MCLCSFKASPFGGWGPGEGFGHLGRRPPPDNPNANFGYDFFGTTKNRFNYSAVVMTHSEPRSMRDPKFVSVVPKVYRLTGAYTHSGFRDFTNQYNKKKSEIQTKIQKIKAFRNVKRLTFTNVDRSNIKKADGDNKSSLQRKTIGPFNSTVASKKFNLKNNKGGQFRTSVANKKLTVQNGLHRSRSNSFINQDRTKVQVMQSQKSKNSKKSKKKISRGGNRGGVELTASDLWKLNRLSIKFSQSQDMKGRKGRQLHNQIPASRTEQIKSQRPDRRPVKFEKRPVNQNNQKLAKPRKQSNNRAFSKRGRFNNRGG